MKHLSKAGTMVLGLAAAFGTARSAAAQELRIAVVDVETLTLASDEGKAAGEKFRKQLDEVTAIMEKARKDIDDKETRLRTQDRVMSATAKAQLTREIDAAKVDFDRKNQDYERQMGELQEQLLGPVSEKARVALEAHIKEKGYSLVIDLSAQGGNVVWANPANDITLDVVARLNAELKKAGGSAPAAAAPAAATPARPAATPASNTTRAPATPATPPRP